MTPSSFILIVDFGSQFTQLIARRIREIGVYSKIIPFHLFKQEWNDSKPNGVILSGSPYSTLSEKSPRLPSDFFSLGVPILGICYGQQLMCMELGGKVESHDSREYGRSFLEITEECPIFEGIWEKGTCHQIWMSHGDRVVSIPQGFKVVGVSSGSPFAAIADEERNFYALQFHPEVVHTPDGIKILKNFVCNIAGVAPNWTMAVCRETAIERIREQAKGEGKILCALSGGVDSSVAALLVHQAIGNRLVCVFVDHGMMRKDEAKEVMDMFKNYSDLSLIFVDASDRFVKALEGETDPEAKRKIIGKSFIEVFEEEAKKIGGAEFLVQGTLYPDVIESVSFSGGPSVTVKSHHNVGGLPERMNMKLIEPLRELFKDEVRNLGRSLGLPEAFIGRHPFPGPGLAVRCLGPVCQEKLEILRNADAIFLDEIRKAGLYDAIWQAFVVLLPVRSVGVMGDDRTYEYVCSLRAVTSVDGMTADFYPFDMTFLSAVSTRIINEVPGINRVVYDVTSKPPGTIEWE